MSPFPPRLAPLVRRRLDRFISQNHLQLAGSFAKSTQELVTIIRKSKTSGRYDRFNKNSKLRERLTPIRYIDRVIENWVQESPRWKRLVQNDNAEWKELCEWLTHAAEKWVGQTRSLRSLTAEDFAQQAIVLMLKAEYPFDVPFKPWALTILYRTIWGKVRSSKDAMDHQPESFEELLLLGELEGTGIEKQFADPIAHIFVQIAHDRDLLWHAMAQLQPKLHIVIELFFFDRLTDEEIARKLNITRANVQTRRHRALERLHDLLTNEPLSGKRGRQH